MAARGGRKVKHGWIDRVLVATADLVFRFPRPIIGFYLVLTAFGGWFAFHNLGFKTSGGDLIAATDKVQEEFLRYQEAFRDDEDLVVMAAGESARAAVEWIAARVMAHEWLSRPEAGTLFYKTDGGRLRAKAWAFLEDGEIEQIGAIFRVLSALDGGKFQFETLLEKSLEAGEEHEGAALLEGLGPLVAALADAAEGTVSKEPLPIGPASHGGSEYLEAGDWTLLLFTPEKTGGGRGGAGPVVEAMREIVTRAGAEFPETEIYLTGEPALAYDEMNTYRSDSLFALGFTVAVVFLVFAYAYRQIVRPLLKIAVLLCAIILALAFTAATVGHLNILSVAFVVMILGLGDDFAIYVITRFEEERKRGHAPKPALENALREAGHSVIMAALTVSISFATMLLTGFVGLAEMGIIAGAGILICAVLCLTFLPALLLQQRRERLGHRHDIRHILTPVLLRCERWWLGHSRWIVLGAVGITLLAGATVVRWENLGASLQGLREGGAVRDAFAGALRIRFSHDLLDMQDGSLESVRAVRLLDEHQSIFMGLVVVDSLEKVAPTAAALAGLSEVSHVSSILGETGGSGRTIPLGDDSQIDRARKLRSMAGGTSFGVTAAVDPVRLQSMLVRLTTHLGMASGFVEGGNAAMAEKLQRTASDALRAAVALGKDPKRAVASVGALQLETGRALSGLAVFFANQDVEAPIEIGDLPAALVSRYAGAGGKFLLEVFPAGDLGDKRFLEAFEREVRSIAPQATGTPILLNVFVDLLRASYTKAALFALVLVTLLLAVYFRGALATVLCLLPLGAGVVLMLATMSWAGLAFNPANIITLPLIIGIGVDNGILILQRFRYEPDIELFSRNTGRAILMSNCSTMAGFLALAMANHQGIASLGLIMSLGIGFTMLVSLVVLPAAIHWLKCSGVKI